MENSILKNTSGLVKQAKPIDVFVFNIGLISVGIALNLIYYYVPQNYVGANIPFSIIISALFIIFIAFNFWCWTVAIPRSGGAYSFVSRSISPILGFSISFIDSIVWLFYNSLACTYLVYLGISPLLFSVGLKTHSQILIKYSIDIQSTPYLFLVGILSIIISSYILIKGMKYFFAFQKIVFTVAIFGTITAFWVLYNSEGNSSDIIIEAFKGYLKIQNTQIISTAFSPKMTMLAAVWPILSYVGSVFSINISSEIQNVNKSQLIGIFGSIVISCIIMSFLAYTYGAAIPTQLQITLNDAYQNKHQLPIAPYFTLIVSLLSKSILYSVLISVGFFCWAFLWIPATIAYSSRALLAWSFDKIVPYKVSMVNHNTFTPVNAIVTVAVANILLLILYLFVPFFNGLVLVLAAMIAWLPVTFSAIIFPYTRKQLYQKTPIAKYTLCNIPVITISGIFGFSSNVVLVWFLLEDEVAAGHSIYSIGTVCILFVTSTMWYLLTKRNVSKKSGFDISKSFEEIPID